MLNSKEDIDRLIKAAEGNEDFGLCDDAIRFIQAMDIYPTVTPKKTATHIIYWQYIQWKKSLGEDKLIPVGRFFRGWKKIYKQFRNDYFREYYLSSDKFLPLTKDEIIQIRLDLERSRRWLAESKKRKQLRKQKSQEKKET